MRYLLALFFVCASAWASPQTSPEPRQFISADSFRLMTRPQQRALVLRAMEAMAAAEEAVMKAGQHPATLPKNDPRRTSWERLRRLQDLLSEMVIPSAHATSNQCPTGANSANFANAAGSGEHCLYAGWPSAFVESGGRRFCIHPSCEHTNNTGRQAYLQAAGQCGPGQLGCNPALFGHSAATFNLPAASRQPLCVPVQSVGPHNASLACMARFQREGNLEGRLDAIINNLLRADNEQGLQEFLRLINNILRTCACEQGAGSTIPAAYRRYMYNHRTCYALLAQVGSVLEVAQDQPGCQLVETQTNGGVAALISGLSTVRQNLETILGDNNTDARIDPFLQQFRDHMRHQRVDDLASMNQPISDIRQALGGSCQDLTQAERRPLPPAGRPVVLSGTPTPNRDLTQVGGPLTSTLEPATLPSSPTPTDTTIPASQGGEITCSSIDIGDVTLSDSMQDEGGSPPGVAYYTVPATLNLAGGELPPSARVTWVVNGQPRSDVPRMGATFQIPTNEVGDTLSITATIALDGQAPGPTCSSLPISLPTQPVERAPATACTLSGTVTLAESSQRQDEDVSGGGVYYSVTLPQVTGTGTVARWSLGFPSEASNVSENQIVLQAASDEGELQLSAYLEDGTVCGPMTVQRPTTTTETPTPTESDQPVEEATACSIDPGTPNADGSFNPRIILPAGSPTTGFTVEWSGISTSTATGDGALRHSGGTVPMGEDKVVSATVTFSSDETSLECTSAPFDVAPRQGTPGGIPGVQGGGFPRVGPQSYGKGGRL